MAEVTIAAVAASEILDSRGNPTVSVEITTSHGLRARAAEAAGARIGCPPCRGLPESFFVMKAYKKNNVHILYIYVCFLYYYFLLLLYIYIYTYIHIFF